MLISRLIPALRSVNLLKNSKNVNCLSIRNSHGAWSYRRPSPPASKRMLAAVEVVQGLMWWWILWHFWTDYGHVIGEYEYPNAEKWTDEELGIE